MARKKAVTKLTCPRCSWDGSSEGKLDAWFRFVEDVTNEHRVEGLTGNGAIEVAAEAVVVHGDQAAIRCGDCGFAFPLPKSLKVKFV